MKGFESPNFTQVPNDFFKLAAQMGEAEMRVTLIIIRETFGWQRKECKATVRYLMRATGMTSKSVQAGIKQAEDRGIVKRFFKDGASHWVCQVVEQPVLPSSTSSYDVVVQTNKEKEKDKTKEVKAEAFTSPLVPDTPLQEYLFERLGAEFEAKGRRPPKQFPSKAIKSKYQKAEERLGDDIKAAIDRGLEIPILAVGKMTDWVAKWGTRPGGAKTYSNGRVSISDAFDKAMEEIRES